MTHKNNHCLTRLFALFFLPPFTTTTLAADEERTRRQIEEVVVTAEKREATVSDTSISITAFSAQMIDDLGIQGADEMVNYIPATTRDEYDIRIRGVGRNFRALGGDPGVATYYNGVYSPDFGIASSENGLYDLARVEVLRGPQGTLYGRNAVGGALNYVTNKPTFDFEGEFRTQFGNFNTREFYGVLSGPLVEDVLAARLVATKRDRDGAMDNLGKGDDVDDVDDRNVALSLLWQPADNLTVHIRGNDRESDHYFSNRVFITEGPAPIRGQLSTDHYALGLRPVDATHPNALEFTDPLTGNSVYGAYNRPGLDPVGFPHQPNSIFGRPEVERVVSRDKEDPNNKVMVNNEKCADDDFPYTNCNSDHEFFGHRAGSAEITWDINPTTSLNYIFGHTDFEYTFNQDLDDSDVDFTKYRQTVLEDVYNYSHELQLHWGVGDRFTATSGLYYYKGSRTQDYSLTNTTNRFTDPFDYGALAGFVAFAGEHKRLGSADPFRSEIGLWEGDERGDAYHYENTLANEQYAAYTQGTYRINDEFQLVLGVRYAKDKKEADENITLRFEEEVGNGGFMDFILLPMNVFDPASPCGPFNILECLTGSFAGLNAAGLTPLGAMNIIWGRAVPTGNPADPIAPVCDLTDPGCESPLMLAGIPFSLNSRTNGSDEWSDVNYRANLDWTPTDNILMYFSVTTGYRAGGYSLGIGDSRDVPRDEDGNPTAGSNVIGEPFSYDKETVVSYEIGYKGMHFDNSLQLNASIYLYDYDDYQDRLDVFDPNRQESVDIVQNAPGARNAGFEVETTWLPTDEITVGGNYSYTKTEYSKDYIIAITDDPSLPQSLFGTADTNPELFLRNVKGDPLKRIPEHKATLWGSYMLSTNMGTFDFRGTYSYTGEFYDEAFQRPLELVPDRFRVDMSITWRDLNDRWKVKAFVDNVTDERNIRGIGTGSEATNWRLTGSMLYPRYYGVDVTYRFGI